MRDIKCKYCGKIYASPSEMRKRKCHSHPNGAWGGYCTPSRSDEFNWNSGRFIDGIIRDCEDRREKAEKRKMDEAEFVREYKKHTPLLDCMLGKDLLDNEPDSNKFEIKNSDLNQLALDLANGIAHETRDAINTIYALRAGCDYVLNYADAQKEGSLGTWLDTIKRLKDEIVEWDFWVALYWLTQPIKDAKIRDEIAFEKSASDDDDYDTKKEQATYWVFHSIAKEFHVKQVIPMLHAVNNKGDKNEKKIMNAIKSYVRKLKTESKQKGLDAGNIRCIETLSQRINDYSFWGILYCLYWMKLRPTLWDDQKVWPIQAAQKDAKAQDTPAKHQATVGANETNYLKLFREQTLGMSRMKDTWMGDPWVINLHKCFKDVTEPFCLISNEDDFGGTLCTRLWSGECTEDAEAGCCKHSGEFLTKLKWKILLQDDRPFLLMSGEFWGIDPNDDEGIYSGIDFSSEALQPLIEEFATWFQEKFYIGDKEFGKEFSHDSSHMWWSVKEPFDKFGVTFPEILKHEGYLGDTRAEIIQLARRLAKFLPYRIDKTTGQTVKEKEKKGRKSLPNNTLSQKDERGPLKELDALIGLGRVKDEVRKLVELVKFNAARKAKGLSAGGMTSHFVFTGNPGTGKTTVARIIAGIYRQLGILKKGHLVEVDRSKLVAGYVGHTAIQTNAIVDSAMDGVLFIDEAYSLIAGGSSDFGSEAIATLLKRMEDARERIIVIVAGYSDEMRQFVRSNPGLESRFTKFIEFPDYSIDELVSIFDGIAKKNQFTCSSNAHELVRKAIEAEAVGGHVSGNARYVRNLFGAVRERMAKRVMKIENASMIQLQTIEAEDFGELVGGSSQQLMKLAAVASVKSEQTKAIVVESLVDMTNPSHEEVEGVYEFTELYDEAEMCREEYEMTKSLKLLEDKWCEYIANSISLRDNLEFFNMDGFYPFYTQQKVRILFVGREACGMRGQNYITTVCPCIKNDNFNGRTVNQYPFHRRQFYIAYGILCFFGSNQGERHFPKWKDVPWASEMARKIFARSRGEAINGLDSISWAFINLSKFSNETDNWQTDYSSRYLPFVTDDHNRRCLKEQISILQPHLIIGANVGELKDVLGYEDCDTTEKACFYYPPTPDGCFPPFLDCYHFAAMKDDESGFYIPVCKVIERHASEIEGYMKSVGLLKERGYSKSHNI